MLLLWWLTYRWGLYTSHYFISYLYIMYIYFVPYSIQVINTINTLLNKYNYNRFSKKLKYPTTISLYVVQKYIKMHDITQNKKTQYNMHNNNIIQQQYNNIQNKLPKKIYMQKDFPSYLQSLDKKNKKQKLYTFKKIAVITLMDMVKEQLGNTLNPKFINNHKKQLAVSHFVIDVTDRHKKWKIIKRLPQFLQLQKNLKHKFNQVPSIPVRKQSQITPQNQTKLLQYLQLFLTIISQIKTISQQKQFIKFLQNFVSPQRKKMKTFKQLQLRKRAGGRHNESSLKKIVSYLTNWNKKYFTITSQGVYFTDNDSDFRIQEMIPFSVGFKLLYGEAQTGYTYGIVLNSAHRLLNIDAENIFNMTYFVYFIRKAMKQNNYLSIKRYHSFADIRDNCNAKYYIDGKNYFADVYDALRQAKSQVCITGWMISPYFCLTRPDPNHQTRIDKVLQNIANFGIKIHIIVYMEPKVALNIDSEFTETYLMSLSPNIKVLRHPAYVLIPFLWSHHQKMVIIDQKIAFIGGLDLGYGRYDDSQHRLLDPNQQIWYGVDYCNYRKTDILKPKDYLVCSIDRKKQPRMPWHDVAVKISGQSVIDLSRHFVQFWNYVNFQLNMDQRQLLIFAGFNQQDIDQIKQNPMQPNRFTMAKKAHQSKRFSKNYNTEVINIAHEREKLPSFIDQDQLMLDHQQEMQFYAHHLKTQSSKLTKLINKFKQKNLGRHAINVEQLVVTQVKQDASLVKGNQKHQFLRSASMWSLGLEQGQEQRSILQAYVELIYNSKQFIYIQNQFFISLQNTISKAIVQRISRAYQNKQKFKMIVVIPSLPGFDGQIYNQNSAVMRVQVHHIYNTICRGGRSIMEQLNFIKNIGDYIQFFTLRTHACLEDKTPVTQLLYVHSKLMIVDDQKVLIGSANINDRSLLGSRDSQIAIVIEDHQQLEIKLKDKQGTRKVKKFAHNLRVELFMQHFGTKRQQMQDYLNQDSWWSMIEHADKNQQIYREVFGIYPDNSMRNYKHILEVQKKKDITKYQLLKQLIKGHAVIFQPNFLDEQNLDLGPSQKQYYVPAINFT